MPPDRSDESWRDAALLLDMMLAAEDALSFVASFDEQAFLASDLHKSAMMTIGACSSRIESHLSTRRCRA